MPDRSCSGYKHALILILSDLPGKYATGELAYRSTYAYER
jgi:hypothetical protein